MTSREKVSVVVPVYRVQEHIAGSMASVAAQELRPLEVILVDDRGGDDSIAMAVAQLERDGIDHRVIVHDRNRMTGAARNSGLAVAQGEWIWFLDPDDRAGPTFLAELVAAAQQHQAAVAICRTLRVDENDRAIGIVEPRYRESVVSGQEAARRLLDNRLRGYSCNKIFRRELLGVDPFDVDRRYEDFRPVLTALFAAARVALVDHPLYRYTDHASAQSAGFGPHTLDLLAVIDDVDRTVEQQGLARRWRTDYLNYRYLNGLLPIANVALRALHDGRQDAAASTALATARARMRGRELGRLWCSRRWRTALTGTILLVAPGLYAAVLKRR